MTPAKRKMLVSLTILRVLEDCQGLLLEENSLFQQVYLEVKPEPLLSEFETSLRELEGLRWVTGISSGLGTRKWGLTDLGKAKLRES